MAASVAGGVCFVVRSQHRRRRERWTGLFWRWERRTNKATLWMTMINRSVPTAGWSHTTHGTDDSYKQGNKPHTTSLPSHHQHKDKETIYKVIYRRRYFSPTPDTCSWGSREIYWKFLKTLEIVRCWLMVELSVCLADLQVRCPLLSNVGCPGFSLGLGGKKKKKRGDYCVQR